MQRRTSRDIAETPATACNSTGIMRALFCPVLEQIVKTSSAAAKSQCKSTLESKIIAKETSRDSMNRF